MTTKVMLHCIICGAPLTETRILREAVTCSPEHARILRDRRRKLRDETKCRLCGRPSTPEERQSYKAWRAATENTPKRGRPRKPKPEEDSPSPLEQHLGSIAV